VHAVRGALRRLSGAPPCDHRRVRERGDRRALRAGTNARRTGRRPVRAHRPQRAQGGRRGQARRDRSGHGRRHGRAPPPAPPPQRPLTNTRPREDGGFADVIAKPELATAKIGNEPKGMRVGVDTGGTFTDLVGDDGRVVKVPSTPDDPTRALRTALDGAGVAASAELRAQGTTVATTALLEGRGGRVALMTTRGLPDVIEIARQVRPSLYDPMADRPPPLVGR